MAEKAEFVLGVNFGTPYGSGCQLIFFHSTIIQPNNFIMDWKNITHSQNSVKEKSFGGTFSFSNCHIIGLDKGSLVLIIFGSNLLCSSLDEIAMLLHLQCRSPPI
jgi:hypothetical protein